MASRAARSDAAYVALIAEADVIRTAIGSGDKDHAATMLIELRTRAAEAAETLGEYDSRKLMETFSELSRSLAAISARPKFSFRARRTAAKPVTGTEREERSPFFNHVPEPPVEPPTHVSERVGQRLLLRGALGALRMANLTQCAVRVEHEVTGSALVRGCKRCVVWLQSRQVRIHDCEDCLFVLRAGSGPIIERCKGLIFAPWEDNSGPDGERWEEIVVGAKREVEVSSSTGQNFWNDVKDFNWLKEEHSPNWRLLGGDEKIDADSRLHPVKM